MLRYLKTHYKYRIGAGGKSLAKLDQLGEGGIVADGYISFETEENVPFLATFEATSIDSSDEVYYQKKTQHLLLDCLAYAWILTTIIHAVFYYEHFVTIAKDGLGANIEGILFVFSMLFAFFYFVLRKRLKYRYIHSIAQFSSYHADDQWIAIGEDVFPNLQSKEITELKRQCVNNGIGLVMIDADECPHLVISPARQDEFGNERKQLVFIDQQSASNIRTFKNVRSFGQKIWQRILQRKNSFSIRFQETNYTRNTLAVLATLLMAYVFYIQLSVKEYEQLDEQAWSDEIEWIDGTSEPMIPMAGTEDIHPFDNEAESYLDLMPLDDQVRDPHLEDIEIFMASDSRYFTYYDCTRLYYLQDKKYFIKWRSFPEFEEAKTNVVRLMQKGIRCNVIWHGCFHGNETGYIVFLDEIYLEKEKAIQKGNFLQAWLSQEDENIQEMSILNIRKE